MVHRVYSIVTYTNVTNIPGGGESESSVAGESSAGGLSRVLVL